MVAEVTGPIEATLTPSKYSIGTIAAKFLTVEELVKVIQSGRFVPRVSVMAPLLERLERLYEDAKEGDDIRGRWRDSLVTLGRDVVVGGSDTAIEGRAEDVDETGALQVRDRLGTLHTVRAGEVTLTG